MRFVPIKMPILALFVSLFPAVSLAHLVAHWPVNEGSGEVFLQIEEKETENIAVM